jgi:hypothetical protein
MSVPGKTVLTKLFDVSLTFLFRLERGLAGREGTAQPGLGIRGEKLPVPFPEEVVVDVEARVFHPTKLGCFCEQSIPVVLGLNAAKPSGVKD